MQTDVVRLPAAQQALLVANWSELRNMATSLHYRYFYSAVGNQYSRDDILQDTWLYMVAAKYPPEDVKELLSWAFVVMRNRCVGRLQKLQKDSMHCYNYVQENEPEEYVYLERRVAEVLHVGKKVLNDIDYQVLKLRAVCDSGQEIADILGIPHATVRGRFFRAKNTLLKLKYNWHW